MMLVMMLDTCRMIRVGQRRQVAELGARLSARTLSPLPARRWLPPSGLHI